ncbi:MAG: ABC transporter permease [Clostridia bacterium]|nr:ABC transporter permease [Clostridia bacterium]
MKWKERGIYLLSLLISIVLGLGVGALLMLATGHDPIEGYTAMVNGALGSKWDADTILKNSELGNTLYRSTLLIITGLATAVASDAGLFNVGGQGQMCLGALVGAYLGAELTTILPFTAGWPVWLLIVVCFLAATLAGAIYALIPALMKVRLNISEVVSTILLNSVALTFCTYMSNGPLKAQGKGTQTAAILKDLEFTRFFKPSNLSQAVFIAAGMALVVWYLMSRTTFGYEMRMAGRNSRFAKFSGLKASTLAVTGMVISGALCGALGMLEVFGWKHRYAVDLSTDFYWDGMLVAMIMRYKPLGIILMSFFFGILKSGAIRMQSSTGISPELIQVIQAIIIFFMAAEQGMILRFRTWRARRHPQHEEVISA